MTIKSNRLLAAVMFSDLEGYTAMMNLDESSARKKIERFKEVNEELHNQNGGQIINFFGDGTVSIFWKNIAPYFK